MDGKGGLRGMNRRILSVYFMTIRIPMWGLPGAGGDDGGRGGGGWWRFLWWWWWGVLVVYDADDNGCPTEA